MACKNPNEIPEDDFDETTFYIVPHWISTRLCLTFPERDIYAILSGGIQGTCPEYFRVEDFSKLIGISERTFHRALSNLEKVGLVQHEKYFNSENVQRIRYKIFFPEEVSVNG